MRKLIWLFMALVLVVGVLPAAAQTDDDCNSDDPAQTRGCDGMPTAQEHECSAVVIVGAWARPSVTQTGAAYGLIANFSGEDVTLRGGSTAAADVVEIHEMVMDGDVMQMNPLADGLVIPAYSAVELMPGGYHAMLIGLQNPLVEGEMLDLSLDFGAAGAAAMTLPIMPPPNDEMMPMESAGHSGGMGQPHKAMAVLGSLEGCPAVHVISAWARPSVTQTGAAYGYIINLGEEDETLLGGSTAAADVVEIHEMIMDGDVMQMNPLADGLVVPSGGFVQLKPGGYHVMFIGLTAPLMAGEMLELSLDFATADDITLTLPIREPDADGMGSMGESGHGH